MVISKRRKLTKPLNALSRSIILQRQDLSKIFSECLKYPAFQEILNLVKINSEGKIWVIGGFVYRNIAAKLNGCAPYDHDIDFIVEKKNETLKEVDGWHIENNDYNNPNYVNNRHRTSFTELGKVHRTSGNKVRSINDYVLETPFNVQSIAYDLETGNLIGEKGVRGLIDKTVKINCFGEAKYYAKIKNKPLNQIIQERAQELGFKAILS